MKKYQSKLKEFLKGNDRKTIIIYYFLRMLVIICFIRELMHGNFQNAMLCVLSLILFIIPFFIEKKFKVELPSVLEIIILLFIFSAEILGEINNFYGNIKHWDTILHTLNGFLCASVGFSLVYLLNENSNLIKLSPIFVSLVAFCFSMTIGVAWEFFEYGMDYIFKTDMQKDWYVNNINTVMLNPNKANEVVTFNEIEYTIGYDEFGNEIMKVNTGYLDIGLHDTMKDLIVNFIGAVFFSVFGYLYIINEKKYKFAGNFMTKRIMEQE